MTVWRAITSLSLQDRQRVLDLAQFDAVKVRAKRAHAREYVPEALAAKEAELAAEHQQRAERARTDPTYVYPLGDFAALGTKPWLAHVSMRPTAESNLELPAGTLLMLDEDAWRTGRYLHIDQDDDRLQALLDGLEVSEEIDAAAGDNALSSPPPSVSIGQSWSLYEAVAWLASGDQALVDHQSLNFMQEAGTKGSAGSLTWMQLQAAVVQHQEDGQNPKLHPAVIACERLRALCEAGTVRASGIPQDKGERNSVRPDEFIGAELWPGKGGALHRIIAGRGEPARWFELRFNIDDVRAVRGGAPMAPPAAPASRATDRSGAPGRPSSMHLIQDELERRFANGEYLSGVAAEARALAQWFADDPSHTGLARPGAKAVENAIRDRFKALQRNPETSRKQNP